MERVHLAVIVGADRIAKPRAYKNPVCQNVGSSWIIASKKYNRFNFLHPSLTWILDGPYYNTTTCSKFNGSYFEYYVTTDRQDRHNIMCSIGDHDRKHPTGNYYSSSGGVITFTPYSTEDVLV